MAPWPKVRSLTSFSASSVRFPDISPRFDGTDVVHQPAELFVQAALVQLNMLFKNPRVKSALMVSGRPMFRLESKTAGSVLTIDATASVKQLDSVYGELNRYVGSRHVSEQSVDP